MHSPCSPPFTFCSFYYLTKQKDEYRNEEEETKEEEEEETKEKVSPHLIEIPSYFFGNDIER